MHIVSLAASGGSLKVEAGAGTGKTSTLVDIARALKARRGTYIAFNRAIADEARRRFPQNVRSSTAHALAFRAVGHYYKARLDQRLTPWVVSEALHLPRTAFNLDPAFQAQLLLGFITRFCQSAERAIGLRHAPAQELLRAVKPERGVLERSVMRDRARALGRELLPQANSLWAALIDPRGRLPITHDVYLKLWALERPHIPGDFILFDEAQDANPIMLELVRNQQHAQHIWVGDTFQSIYQWRGAVNAMAAIATEHTAPLTQSFRFGEAVAGLANAILKSIAGAEGTLRGTPTIDSRIARLERPRAILSRTNLGVIGQVLDCLQDNRKPMVAGGVRELLRLLESAEKLMHGVPVVSGDLAGFRDWESLVEYSESELGRDLQPLVKMVDEYGARLLIKRIEPLEGLPESRADLIVSTAHKSKGLEWDSVLLDADFKGHDEEADPAELTARANLLYVAATRGMRTLDISLCEPACAAIGVAGESLPLATPEARQASQATGGQATPPQGARGATAAAVDALLGQG
ncbi:superfamily I DNA/RNA helicase [Natronocella acetinitrilica]|uniref:Superfamily I DNA/RNA helicase n=1 Tax=Natronocella acetinitrilica TaxID=414046 RepID=A0AAE3KAX9_9GAMM|nr:superfamily I DNA/RNA helicase [Natronocella acetinitrilica]